MNKKKLGMIDEFRAIVDALRPGSVDSLQSDDYIIVLEAHLFARRK